MNAKDLIFDVGAHTGEDTDFYLRKGFRVVAIEPCPEHVQSLRQRFASSLISGMLVLEDVAIGNTSGEGSFLVHKTRSDWHRSAHDPRRFVEDDFVKISVEYVTFDKILKKHGVPYYLKLDIESSEWSVIRHLQADARPNYVSFEIFHDYEQCLKHLQKIGYRKFLLVDQSIYGHSPKLAPQPPNPAKEGSFAPARFNGHMSGLFGKELSGQWVGFDTLMEAIPNLPYDRGEWFDVHAQ